MLYLKTFHHPIGLRVPRRNQAMPNLMAATGLIKSVCASRNAFPVEREAVGEFLAIICPRLRRAGCCRSVRIAMVKDVNVLTQ